MQEKLSVNPGIFSTRMGKGQSPEYFILDVRIVGNFRRAYGHGPRRGLCTPKHCHIWLLALTLMYVRG